MREQSLRFYEGLALRVSLLFAILLVAGGFWILMDASCFPSPEQEAGRNVLVPGMIASGAAATGVLFVASALLRSWVMEVAAGLVLAGVLIAIPLFVVFGRSFCVT